jgi:hypothetical protein
MLHICWRTLGLSRLTRCATSPGRSSKTFFTASFRRRRLDMEINDRFRNPAKPCEWFLVPLPVVEEVVKRIKDETIVDYEYDFASASLVRRA